MLILSSQHPRRQGRQLLEGLGKLLGDLLGGGDYDDYYEDHPIPDNIALSLYGEWPWQGRRLITILNGCQAQL